MGKYFNKLSRSYECFFARLSKDSFEKDCCSTFSLQASSSEWFETQTSENELQNYLNGILSVEFIGVVGLFHLAG